MAASTRTTLKLHNGTPDEAGMDPARVRRIVERGQQWVDEGVTPSLVLLAARRGVVFLHEGFGTLHAGDSATPVLRDTIFPQASLSKPMTATAVMLLVEDGALGLTRAVQDYIPEFQGKGKDDVLVWHLLTHTSGLREQDISAFVALQPATAAFPPPEPTQHPAINQMLQLRYRAPLWKPPGEEMSYCSFNYWLLAEIVRRLSGVAFASLLQQRVFAPLGMADSSGEIPDEHDDRVARMPATAPLYRLIPPPPNPLPANGGNGVHASAMDLAIFGQTFLNRGSYGDVRLLSSATVREMTRNQIPGISAKWFGEFRPEASWGYGWSIHGGQKWMYSNGSLQPPETYAHGGAGQTYLWIDPINEIVGVYCSIGVEMEHGLPKARYDLFQNLVYGALDE
ncbi:MAG: serine hydrolase domain-containing protein [Dehalococcoidia bacterium]